MFGLFAIPGDARVLGTRGARRGVRRELQRLKKRYIGGEDFPPRRRGPRTGPRIR